MRPVRALLLGVPLVWVALAHVGPLLTLAGISAMDAYPTPPGTAPLFDLSAYTDFIEGPGYRASLLRSLELAAATSAVSLALAFPLAYHVALRVPAGQRVRRLALLVAPFWTSEVLRLFALALVLANRGAANGLLRELGLIDRPLPLLYGSGAVLAGTVYTVFLCMLLPVYASLDRLPRAALDAASTLGAGSWSRLWHVTLPLAAKGISSGILLTFLASLGVFTAPTLLGGPGTPVFATTIAGLFGAASGRWPSGAAFGFILLAVGTAGAAALAALPRALGGRTA